MRNKSHTRIFISLQHWSLEKTNLDIQIGSDQGSTGKRIYIAKERREKTRRYITPPPVKEIYMREREKEKRINQQGLDLKKIDIEYSNNNKTH